MSASKSASLTLNAILEQHPQRDWRATSISAEMTRYPPEAAELLASYQRLLHVLPRGEEARGLPLIEHGLCSAVQIAGMPKPEVLAAWEALFPGEAALGELVYQRAIERRAFLTLLYLRRLQSREPHYAAARFR